MYRPGDIFYSQFTVSNVSGVASNADSLPLGNLVKNGVDDNTPRVFVTNIDIGRYTTSGIIPSAYAKGDTVGVIISGYVGGSLTKAYTSLGQLDTYYTGDIVNPGFFSVNVTGIYSNVTAPTGFLDTIKIENNVNLRQALSLIGAACAGSSVVNGNNITYYGINNSTTTRITSTSASGYRQSITIYLP